MLENLKEIIKELKEIKTDTELLLLEDNVLFDCAVRIYNNRKIDKSKKENIDKIQNNKEKNMEKFKEEPATSRQIWKLNQLNIEIKKGLTKQEASKLIKESQ